MTKKRRKLFLGIAVSIIIAVIILLSVIGTQYKTEEKYIGKVLRISGSVNDYGLVKDYKKGRYIVLVHFYKHNQPAVVHKLRGKYSFTILAENIEEYRDKNKVEESQPLTKGEQKEIYQEDKQTDVIVEDENNDIIGESDQSVSTEKETIPKQKKNDTVLSEEEKEEQSWASELDKKRMAGLNFLEKVVKDCSQKSEILQEKQVNYEKNCVGFTYDTYGNQINKSLTPGCRLLQSEMNTLKEDIRLNMVNALRFARKHGVYPGQIRETCEKYGLNKNDWE